MEPVSLRHYLPRFESLLEFSTWRSSSKYMFKMVAVADFFDFRSEMVLAIFYLEVQIQEFL